MHRRLELNNDDEFETMRPDMSVWGDDDDAPTSIVIQIAAAHGASQRFINLTPAEARQLARYLTDTAKEVEDTEQEDDEQMRYETESHPSSPVPA